MSSGIQLIVGLGNPGKEYEHTRHNAGAWFVRALAEDANISLRANKQFHGEHGLAKVKGHECHLLIPSTFMNLSGLCVKSLAAYYKIPTNAILVAHDELDIAVGDIRLKFSGGHGGHNGLRDIAAHLNSKDFHRLRIGIGHPGVGRDVSDYVLSPPKKSELPLITEALQKAEGILPFVMLGEFQKAMQVLHSE